MVTIILFLLFFVMLLKNYEKTYILLIITSVFLRHFALFNESLYAYLSIFAVSLFPFKLNKSFSLRKDFPFSISICCLISSFIISNFTSSIKHNFLLIKNIVDLINILIIWIILKKNTIETIRFAIRTVIVFGSIISLYALFETITRTNPFIDITQKLNLYISDYVVTEIRYGLKRSQSIFSMHTTNGGISILLFIFLLYMKIYKVINLSKYVNIIIALLFLSVFLTGSRAAIIGCVICSFMFFRNKYLKGKWIMFILLLTILASSQLIEYLQTIYSSILDTQKVGGSNSDMRSMQFQIAYYFLQTSLWFGHGLAYTFEYVQYYYDDLYGAESLWIPVMIDQGIIGILSHLILFANCLYYVWINRQYRMLYFVIGFYTFNTLSSIPNIPIFLLPIFLIFMIEVNKIKNKV